MSHGQTHLLKPVEALLAILVLFSLGLSTSAMAAGDLDTIAQCRAIESAAQRLACYDRNVDAMAAPIAATGTDNTKEQEENADPIKTDNVAAADPESIFGIPAAKVVGEGPEQIDAVIQKITDNGSRALITLENGQVWQQASSSTLRLAAGDSIVIKRKAFGSFRLSKPGSSRPMRVKRIE